MPEAQREITATRIALLELKDEQRLVQEGYTLLDEKRILLAHEIQRQLALLAALRRQSAALESELFSRTVSAVRRHGMDELAVYPPLTLAQDRLVTRRSRLLGLELLQAHLEKSVQSTTSSEQPVNPTPEARACAQAHLQWLFLGVELAGCCVNLRRLARDYVRTERRAKAIENVLLPEIMSSLKFITEQLEGQDQEEVARLRGRGTELA